MHCKEASLLVSNVYVSEGSSKTVLNALKVRTSGVRATPPLAIIH